jgi:hypothetical protein
MPTTSLLVYRGVEGAQHFFVQRKVRIGFFVEIRFGVFPFLSWSFPISFKKGLATASACLSVSFSLFLFGGSASLYISYFLFLSFFLSASLSLSFSFLAMSLPGSLSLSSSRGRASPALTGWWSALSPSRPGAAGTAATAETGQRTSWGPLSLTRARR